MSIQVNGEQVVNQRQSTVELIHTPAVTILGAGIEAQYSKQREKVEKRKSDVFFLFREERSAMLVAQLCDPGLEVRHNRCSGVVPTDVYWPASHETRSAKLDASSV